jgi:hypothetical protein
MINLKLYTNIFKILVDNIFVNLEKKSIYSYPYIYCRNFLKKVFEQVLIKVHQIVYYYYFVIKVEDFV